MYNEPLDSCSGIGVIKFKRKLQNNNCEFYLLLFMPLNNILIEYKTYSGKILIKYKRYPTRIAYMINLKLLAEIK